MEQGRALQDPLFSSERQPLLSPPSTVREDQVQRYNKHHTCSLSKAVVALIALHTIVGASYSLSMNTTMWLGYSSGDVSEAVLVGYSLVAVIALLSPLSGFLADVYYGRYKLIFIGLGLIWGAFLLLSVDAIVTIALGLNT